jgi:hypothetical protein
MEFSLPQGVFSFLLALATLSAIFMGGVANDFR